MQDTVKKNRCSSDTVVMNKTHTPSLVAIFALMILLFLPGYQKQLKTDHYPAPLEKPAVAFYCNFAASGLYDQGKNSSEALQEILLCVDAVCRDRQPSETAAVSAQKTASAIISDRIMSGDLKVHDLFFYLGSSENFALIMRGEFSTGKISELIGKDRVSKNKTGLITFVKSPVSTNSRLYLEVRDDLLFICPENNAGNLLANIDNQKNVLGEELAAFNKMVRNRPALASEISFTALQKNIGFSLLPAWLEPMQHMRLIAADRLSKLQMFVPDKEAREALKKTMTEQKSVIKNLTGAPAELNLEVKGNSIFIEAPPELNLEASVSRRMAAFALHFFAGSNTDSKVLRAASND